MDYIRPQLKLSYNGRIVAPGMTSFIKWKVILAYEGRLSP